MTKKREHDLCKIAIGEREDADDSFEDIFSSTFFDRDIEEEIAKRKKAAAKPQSPGAPTKKNPAPQAVLDLHGETRIKAVAKVTSFMQASRHQGFQTVRIITGKGRHSPAAPVLSETVEKSLRELKNSGVIQTWRWESKNRKKTGSVLVFMTRNL
jgi:DNA-nicking Smr family endonuclease